MKSNNRSACSAMLFWTLLAVPTSTVESATWIDARKATFVAQFQMNLSPSCTPPDSVLHASCTDGVIEPVQTSHPSIQCFQGTTESVMSCSIFCGEDCEEVFLNGNIASVSYACAVAAENPIASSVVLVDEHQGECAADLFHGSQARRVAKLNLLCQDQDGNEVLYIGHKNFECGLENEATYLSNGEFGCVEEIDCKGSACDLAIPSITVTSFVEEGDIGYDCLQPTTILAVEDDTEEDTTIGNQENSDTMLDLFSATYRASWTLYSSASTSCESSDASTVEISCQSGGTVTDFQVHGGMACNRQSKNSLACTGDAPVGNGFVIFSCAGDSLEKALSSLHYDEAYHSCDSEAYHLVHMGALCEGDYSYQDFYWECAEGNITIDQNGYITCFENLPCASNSGDCSGTITGVTMEADPNVADCMVITPLSEQPSSTPTTSLSPSVAPTRFPTSAPSRLPSDSPSWVPTFHPTQAPSASPSKSPSTTPSKAPSMAPSLTPSTSPSAWPTSYPSLPPSDLPSLVPTNYPTTRSPSGVPSKYPTLRPTSRPSATPSNDPSAVPSKSPSAAPSNAPSMAPSKAPSAAPSKIPSTSPSALPTPYPSSSPSDLPSLVPTTYPTTQSPSGEPSKYPTVKPAVPSHIPTHSPILLPSDYPSIHPPEWPESSTNLPTGHRLDDDYISPTADPTRIGHLNNNHSTATIEEGVSALSDEELDEKTTWTRNFTYIVLLMVGVTISFGATLSCRRYR